MNDQLKGKILNSKNVLKPESHYKQLSTGIVKLRKMIHKLQEEIVKDEPEDMYAVGFNDGIAAMPNKKKIKSTSDVGFGFCDVPHLWTKADAELIQKYSQHEETGKHPIIYTRNDWMRLRILQYMAAIETLRQVIGN